MSVASIGSSPVYRFLTGCKSSITSSRALEYSTTVANFNLLLPFPFSLSFSRFLPLSSTLGRLWRPTLVSRPLPVLAPARSSVATVAEGFVLRAAAAAKQALAAAVRASSRGVPDLHLTPQQIRAVGRRNYSEDTPICGSSRREPVLPQRAFVPEADLLV